MSSLSEARLVPHDPSDHFQQQSANSQAAAKPQREGRLFYSQTLSCSRASAWTSPIFTVLPVPAAVRRPMNLVIDLSPRYEPRVSVVACRSAFTIHDSWRQYTGSANTQGQRGGRQTTTQLTTSQCCLCSDHNSQEMWCGASGGASDQAHLQANCHACLGTFAFLGAHGSQDH